VWNFNMQQLFIHLHAQGASWAHHQRGEGLPGEIEHGPLSAIPVAGESDEVIVFVPAGDVLLTTTTLPRQSRQRLQRAVPYALEEQFVDDVESLHVALGSQQGDGRVYAAVVAEAKMQSWLDDMQAAGINPTVIMPENLALPLVNGDWSALCMPGGLCTVRSGEQSGFACERENLAILAKRHQVEQPVAAHQVNVTDCTGDEADVVQLEQTFGLPVSVEACNGDALASLIKGYVKGRGINLRQGKYRIVSPLLRGGRRWLPAAVMLALWLVLVVANSVSEYISLRAENEAYRDKITQLYKQTFPDAKRIVNARVQMEQRLNTLRSSSVSDEGFLALMAEVGTALAKAKGLDVQNLSYKQGKLDLDIKLGDLQQLDNLKQTLVAIQGIEVDVQSATVKNNKLESRIRIGRRK
jgi:general secretion pathway protein L